jgi:antitoxin YefM
VILYSFLVNNIYTITKAQAKLATLARFHGADIFTITKHDKPIAALVKWERLESILESLEILSDRDAMKHIREARAGKGKYLSLASLKKELREDR